MISWFRHGPFAFWAVAVFGGLAALVLLGVLGTTGDSTQEAGSPDVRWELLDAYGQTVGLEGTFLEERLTYISEVADRCEEPICLNIATHAADLAEAVAAGQDDREIFEGRLALGRLINQYVANPGVSQ